MKLRLLILNEEDWIYYSWKILWIFCGKNVWIIDIDWHTARCTRQYHTRVVHSTQPMIWCSVSFICARKCKQLLLQMNRRYFVCSKWKPFGFTISIWGWIQRALTGRKCCHLVCPPDDKLPCFRLEWLSGTLTYQMDNNGCLASLC